MKRMNLSTRKLKICYAIYPRTRKKYPVINLGGKYLSSYGFNIGDFVELSLEQGYITIKASPSLSNS